MWCLNVRPRSFSDEHYRPKMLNGQMLSHKELKAFCSQSFDVVYLKIKSKIKTKVDLHIAAGRLFFLASFELQNCL